MHGQLKRGMCAKGEEWWFRAWLATQTAHHSHLGSKTTIAQLPPDLLNQNTEGQNLGISLILKSYPGDSDVKV